MASHNCSLRSHYGPTILEREGGEVVLGSHDIFFVDIGPVFFFVDIGPVFEGIEEDGGEPFVTGSNPHYARAATDVREIWDDVRNAWFVDKMTGRDLYEFAERCCVDRGWRLNLELTGHRISEYPRHAHFDGSMSGVDIVPAPDLWVLEIGLADPTHRFGAFYEDTLLDEQSFGV